MSRSSREHRKLAVILADIDHFKQINDRFGHAAGDAVLKCVATVFESELRPYDTVGRYGGEEFLMIVPGVNHVRGMEVAERLRKRVEQTLALQEIAGHAVTVSLGVAITTGESGAEEVIDAADSSMYAAKAAGRNRGEMRCPSLVSRSDGKLPEYAGA
jgi:diguanylate cyclase (GGDEF)-like protein